MRTVTLQATSMTVIAVRGPRRDQRSDHSSAVILSTEFMTRGRRRYSSLLQKESVRLKSSLMAVSEVLAPSRGRWSDYSSTVAFIAMDMIRTRCDRERERESGGGAADRG